MRTRLPNRRASLSFNFDFEGHCYRVSASRFRDGRLAEIFLNSGKPNTAVQANAETAAILVSLLLQHGIEAAEIRRSLHGPIAIALDLVEAPS